MKEELQELGLTKGEANVYLALLKIGSSTIGPIAKESKIAYSKIYEVLQRLINKGLVSYNLRNKTKHFTAVSPTRLKDFLKSKEEKIKESYKILDSLLPNLEKLKDSKEVQTAEIFLGFNGLKTAYELLLKDADKKFPLCFFYVHDEKFAELANDFYKREFLYFREKGIKLRGISTYEYKKSRHFHKTPKFIELKFVNFPLPSTIDIFGNKILLTTWSNSPFVCLIESKEIAENFRKYFDIIWKISKK